MYRSSLRAPASRSPWGRPRAAPGPRRSFLTLAIETSCDDTSVALLETSEHAPSHARLLFHQRATSASTHFRGIHPLHAHEGHQAALPGLVAAARLSHAERTGTPLAPDLVAATRGPGILACLQVGLNTAKGLALAWDAPLVGAHHMQAHALTPRLEAALSATDAGQPGPLQPAFPFLSLLVSGGHTLLLRSDGLAEHAVLAASADIAVGDCLDKVGRALLPAPLLDSIVDSGYGRLLEAFASPHAPLPYHPPATRAEEVAPRVSRWGWSVPRPTLASRDLRLSFSGIESTVARTVAARAGCIEDAERRELAAEALTAAFELVALRAAQALHAQPAADLVVSGGVAASAFLRRVLRAVLDARGLAHVRLSFPRPELCTDNAAMIAWAAWEMWCAGWCSDLNCPPIRRWPLGATDGDAEGLLCQGWKRRPGF